MKITQNEMIVKNIITPGIADTIIGKSIIIPPVVNCSNLKTF
jgi:hypothetical protein